MRKLLVFIVCVSLCISLFGCSGKGFIREKVQLDGLSDGSFSFTEGNIKFTVPEGQFYRLTQSEVTSSDKSFGTFCALGQLVDSTTIISAIPVDDRNESEVVSLVSAFVENEAEEYANHTRFDDLILDIMGHEVAFRTYLNEAEENARFYMETTFTDSHYIYRIEIQLPEITEERYAAVFQMICFSEYIGPEMRFEFFQ